jgi:hypothetical protein
VEKLDYILVIPLGVPIPGKPVLLDYELTSIDGLPADQYLKQFPLTTKAA